MLRPLGSLRVYIVPRRSSRTKILHTQYGTFYIRLEMDVLTKGTPTVVQINRAANGVRLHSKSTPLTSRRRLAGRVEAGLRQG